MFLHRISALLHFVGCSLATCVKLPSGAKCCARKALALLFVLSFSICMPVFAGNEQYTSGFIYPESGLAIRYQTSGYDLDVLSGYFPAAFSSSDATQADNVAREFFVIGNTLPHPSGTYTYNLSTSAQFYIEVLYSVPATLTFDLASLFGSTPPTVYSQCGVGSPSSPNSFDRSSAAADISFVVDSDLKPLNFKSGTTNQFEVPMGSYKVNRYWGYRFYFNPLNLSSSNSIDLAFKLSWREGGVKYTFSDPDYLGSINQNVTVNTGILQEIDGTLKEIQTSTTQIQQDVSHIKDTVTDTHNQLQNPDSNIWKAAGSAISDAVTGLFVPEQAQLDAKMKELENIVITKMGDTYEVIQKTQVYEDQFVAGFTGGGSDYAFHFPGITVPLPDSTVSILPEQDVHLQNKAFNVFRNLLGTIVAVLCGFSAVHLGHDFIICIFSGVSYWGFLRSRHDK